MNRLHIRHATPADAASIAKIHIQSWQETYADIFSQTFLDSLQVQERQKHWFQTISNKEELVFMAEKDGAIVGFSSLAMRQTPKKNCPYLATLYLLQAFQKQGIGQQLFDAVRSKVKECPSPFMYIEVLEQNDALHFYQKCGSQIIARRPLISQHAQTSELLLRCPVDKG